MADKLPEPPVLLAARDYKSDNFHKITQKHDLVPVIPMRRTRELDPALHRAHYRARNVVKRYVDKLKSARRVTIRDIKTAERFPGFIDTTSVHPWLRRLSTRPGVPLHVDDIIAI